MNNKKVDSDRIDFFCALTLGMKKICVFVHYSNFHSIPYYVLQYVRELSLFFDEILVVTNERKISNKAAFLTEKLTLLEVKNDAYDLGMFAKGFASLDLKNYQQVACINDSNILLKDLNFLFKWAEKQPLDMWGLMDSNEKTNYSTHENNHHVQSHFLVFNKKALPTLTAYFEQLDLQRIIDTEEISEVKKRVINDWEIGVSQFLIKNGHQIGAYFHREKYINKTYQPHVEMLRDGMPTLKKKIVTSVKPRDLFAGKNYWSKLVKRYAQNVVDPLALLPELKLIRRNYLFNAAKHFFKKPFNFNT